MSYTDNISSKSLRKVLGASNKGLFTLKLQFILCFYNSLDACVENSEKTLTFHRHTLLEALKYKKYIFNYSKIYPILSSKSEFINLKITFIVRENDFELA